MQIFDIEILWHSLEVVALVSIMMILIDWIDVRTRGKIPTWISHHRIYQYVIASIFGLIPACMGSYLNVSLYMHGYLSLGAIVGGMISTTGEASLIMFAEFPRTALYLHLILLISGIFFAFITDLLVRQFKIPHKRECHSLVYHSDETSALHYFRYHIWDHLLKKHIWRIFLWTFFAIWFTHIGTHYFDLEHFIKSHPQLILFIAVLIGLIPDIAPQFIFVFMFSTGLIPFSILLTSSMVQNGHGMLPLLSYSLRDSIIVKSFNVIFGLLTGILMMSLGW